MRTFEIYFYRNHRLTSRAWHQGIRRGHAVAFARALLSLRGADSFHVKEC